MADKPLRILALKAENIKRLVAVYIAPNGNLIELTGRNRQGKTSALDAIWIALGGKNSIPSKPIRTGANQGSVALELGDKNGVAFKVTRKLHLRDDGSTATTLVVENADGMRAPSPQALLDTLFTQFSIDPIDFIRAPAKDQFDTVKAFVPDFDFEASERLNKADFDRRTAVNREAKTLRAQEAGILIPVDAPAKRIDESALIEELELAGQQNAQIAKQEAARTERAREVERLDARAADHAKRIGALNAQIASLMEEAVAFTARADAIRQETADMAALPDPIDTAMVRAEIDEAKATNARYDVAARARAHKAELGAAAEAAERVSACLTEQIEQRKVDKTKAIAGAKMPIDGLSLDEGQVLLNGLPLDQASAAEQLRVSVAIAAALNPRLRFIRIKDASLLDDDSWKELGELADKMDVQIFAETVNSGRESAIVIEDGQVKSPAATEKAA